MWLGILGVLFILAGLYFARLRKSKEGYEHKKDDSVK